MYGHIGKIAEAEKAGIEAAGGKVDVYQYGSLNNFLFQSTMTGATKPVSTSERTKRRS